MDKEKSADTLQPLIALLHAEGCSLVVRDSDGVLHSFNKKGVRDLIWLLDNSPATLRDAVIADKVIGKAAAGLIAQGGVAVAYADVMSRRALPILEAAGISYSYAQLVEAIEIPEGSGRCPLEKIVEPAGDAGQVEALLRSHFREMKEKQNDNI